MPDATVLLASHGFTTMSLAYFGAKGLPSKRFRTSRLNTSERRSGGCAIAPKQIPVLLRYSVYPGVRRRPYSSPRRIPMCRPSWHDPRAMFDGKAPHETTPWGPSLDLARQAADLRSHPHPSVVCRAICVGFHGGRSGPADSAVPARFGSLRRYSAVPRFRSKTFTGRCCYSLERTIRYGRRP